MRLKKLRAKNFRTLEDVELNFPTNYCTVSGPNNAGKSCIMKLICSILRASKLPFDRMQISYEEDRTQWVAAGTPIEVVYSFELEKLADSAVVSRLEHVGPAKSDESSVGLEVRLTVGASGKRILQSVSVEGAALSEVAASELLLKLKSISPLIYHNSVTSPFELLLRSSGEVSFAYPANFSKSEILSIQKAEQRVQQEVRKITKVHKGSLDEMLGKLRDKYEATFTINEPGMGMRMPLGLNLTDRSVDVPLLEWGSGTQNRTRILMSMLHAAKMKGELGQDDKITPIVLIEEPESFLHPSAQAEFGVLLQKLSGELDIQIIATTHSPYILNQVHTASNILLRRRIFRKKLLSTEIVDTSGDEWMAPFAEQLGIIAPEFDIWKDFFGRAKDRVILVEGELDKQYFDHLTSKYPEIFPRPSGVEIFAYGGKEALKVASLIRFALSRTETAVITMDLDALGDVERSLGSIGLKIRHDYFAIGEPKDGKENIEGLLPDSVLNAVNGREPDLIRQLVSGKDKKSAKSKLKSKYLEEMKSQPGLSANDLKPLRDAWAPIIGRFQSKPLLKKN